MSHLPCGKHKHNASANAATACHCLLALAWVLERQVPPTDRSSLFLHLLLPGCGALLLEAGQQSLCSRKTPAGCRWESLGLLLQVATDVRIVLSVASQFFLGQYKIKQWKNREMLVL